MNYGFIITRHVNSEKTNLYWNECLLRIRLFYPTKEIVVIDDNSNEQFVTDFHHINNVRFIKSEFIGAGEILPYYYLHKYRFFPAAVILHDSVFFQTRVKFEILTKFPIMPLWHFDYQEDLRHAQMLMVRMKNTNQIRAKLSQDTIQTFSFKKQDKWRGCFGVQSYISLSFLDMITKKYNIMSMVSLIKNRKDRCSLERIMGIIFSLEFPFLTEKRYSLFGDIWKYERWGSTYDEYKARPHLFSNRPLIKVWTGR